MFNFGASDSLAGQIQSEGTADVFASASGTWMDAVEEDPGVSDRTDFVKNRLVIITPPDNPAGIASIEDLATPGVQLVLAAEGVPVGRLLARSPRQRGHPRRRRGQRRLQRRGQRQRRRQDRRRARPTPPSSTNPTSRRRRATRSTRSQIPEDVNVIATYPIAVVTGAPNATLAAAFVAYVAGPEGQATLTDYGFESMSLIAPCGPAIPLLLSILAVVGAVVRGAARWSPC